MLDEAVMDDALAGWFEHAGRTLALRTASSPWAVLVGEVMSQQTQIARVGPFWERVVERWRTPTAFALASTRDVLEAWAGLGYNRRPLALRDAARRIVAEHSGNVPSDVAALEALPGVGPYTARAVAANAFGLPVAPVDVNIRRVITRLTGATAPRALQAEADRLISRRDPAAWVHAVMDLAVSVCLRRAPLCEACPLAPFCPSRGTDGEAPRRRSQAGAFEDSTRWLRGRIVGRLRAAAPGAWVSFDEPLGGHGIAAVRSAVSNLAAEGFLEQDGNRARLA